MGASASSVANATPGIVLRMCLLAGGESARSLAPKSCLRKVCCARCAATWVRAAPLSLLTTIGIQDDGERSVSGSRRHGFSDGGLARTEGPRSHGVQPHGREG